MTNIYCISINFKNAQLSVRSKFAFSKDNQNEILNRLIGIESITQCVLICTCNRTELYIAGKENCFIEAEKILAEYGNFNEEELKRFVLIYDYENAINHLFRVCAGIESMVIGEDEILGQVKDAYSNSLNLGLVGYELNVIFQSAVTCAKKIKTKTAISKTSVSTATLTSNCVAKWNKNVTVLLIGASGKIGSTVLKNLISHSNVKVIVTLRNHNTDFEMICSGKNNVEYIDYEKRFSYVDRADCIVSATSSPHYTITASELNEKLTEKKKRLIIDLAVPPDIDENVTQIDGVTLHGIDYFDKLAEHNNLLKMDSVEKSKAIINEDIETLKKELTFHNFLPKMEKVKSNLSGKTLEEILYCFKSQSNSKDFENILKTLEKLGG